MGKQLARRKPAVKAIAIKKQSDVFTLIGLDKFLKPNEDNLYNLITVIRKGLPKKVLDNLAKLMGFTSKQTADILNLSERTLQRYDEKTLLDKKSTEHTILIAELYESGIGLFKSADKFNGWMNYPNLTFQNKKPIELLDTIYGIKLVQDEVNRLRHGIYV